MLGGVLGCHIQGGITFKGALLFSVYGIIGSLNKTVLYKSIDAYICWHYLSFHAI